MERTRSEYPGAFSLGEKIPTLTEIEEVFREVLETDDVISVGLRDPASAQETALCFSKSLPMRVLKTLIVSLTKKASPAKLFNPQFQLKSFVTTVRSVWLFGNCCQTQLNSPGTTKEFSFRLKP